MRKILTVFMALVLAACGGGIKNGADVQVGDSAATVINKSSASDNFGERLISYTVSIDLKVKSRVTAKDKISDKVEELKGYVAEEGRRRMVVSIPTKELKNFGKYLDTEVGKVEDSSWSGQDITHTYDDISARLTTLRASRDRYLALLGSTTKVEEILKIEKELERVNTDIQKLELQKKRAENSVDYSRVTINLTDSTLIYRAIVTYSILGAVVLFLVI